MEAFRAQLSFMREVCVNFIVKLPPEIAYIILGYLDNESFTSAAKVSHHWANRCRSSAPIRHITNTKINFRKTCQQYQWGSRSISTKTLWSKKKVSNKYTCLEVSRVANRHHRSRQGVVRTFTRCRL